MKTYELKRYSVVLLLNGDGSKILLQTKDRTAYAGMLNGVGGKIEKEESPMVGAIREIEEETTLTVDDIEDLTWIGTLVVPTQCDTNSPDTLPELYFYAGRVRDEAKAKKAPDETEDVSWYGLRNANTVVTDLELAGDGNLPYFIGIARKLLFGGNPVNFE